MFKIGALVGLLCFAILAHAAEIKGKVVNAAGGEALGRVQITVLETGAATITAGDGTFSFTGLPPGHYTLRLNAVSYRLVTVSLSLATPDESRDLSLAMAPDNFRRTEKVKVEADIFQASSSPSTTQFNLTSSEIRETSTVIADDPFRSVQAMPGVSPSANNDFFAQFSVMGTPYETVGIYIDDVLVPNPFLGTPNMSVIPEGATVSVLTSEAIEDIKLLPVAYPEKFGDEIGAALDIHTREGSFSGPLFRASVGMAETDLLGEGRLGGSQRGSWLAEFRKSYLGYLLQDRLDYTFTNVSFYNANLKLSYDLTPHHNLSLYAVSGHSSAKLENRQAPLTPNDFASGSNDFTLARVGWRWSLSPTLLLDTRGAYIREPFQTLNSADQILVDTYYGEWVGGSSITWNWSRNHVMEGGWTTRRIRQSGYEAFFDPTTGLESTSALPTGQAFHNTGYVQQGSSFLGGRLHAEAGLRYDQLEHYDAHLLSPQVGLSFRAAAATQLQFAYGHYVGFPGVSNAPVVCYALTDSNHFTAGVEQRLTESTRLRLQGFDRQNTQSLSSSCGQAQPSAVFRRDYSRGAQLVLQRRSANRLSGWLGYTLTYARVHNYAVTLPGYLQPFGFDSGSYYPTLQDQRHTLNVFANYRLTPTINLSGKWLFGSGFPVPSETFRKVGNDYVPVHLNDSTLGPYERLDLRLDKAWAFRRWKLTFYGEILNLTNHDNLRFLYSGGIDPNTGKTSAITEQGLPITPSAGLVFEF